MAQPERNAIAHEGNRQQLRDAAHEKKGTEKNKKKKKKHDNEQASQGKAFCAALFERVEGTGLNCLTDVGLRSGSFCSSAAAADGCATNKHSERGRTCRASARENNREQIGASESERGTAQRMSKVPKPARINMVACSAWEKQTMSAAACGRTIAMTSSPRLGALKA